MLTCVSYIGNLQHMTLTVCIPVVLLIRNVYYLCAYNVNLYLYEAYTVCADSQDLPSVFAMYN